MTREARMTVEPGDFRFPGDLAELQRREVLRPLHKRPPIIFGVIAAITAIITLTINLRTEVERTSDLEERVAEQREELDKANRALIDTREELRDTEGDVRDVKIELHGVRAEKRDLALDLSSSRRRRRNEDSSCQGP